MLFGSLNNATERLFVIGSLSMTDWEYLDF
jgi:hypothetical protein